MLLGSCFTVFFEADLNITVALSLPEKVFLVRKMKMVSRANASSDHHHKKRNKLISGSEIKLLCFDIDNCQLVEELIKKLTPDADVSRSSHSREEKYF